MDGLLRQLIDLLLLEERVYRELAAVLREERELIVSLDADGLDALARRKDALAAEARIAEESRVGVARSLGRELGVAEEPVTLRLLCERVGEPDLGLRDAQTRLVAVVGAVRELVDANRVLGGNRLANVQTTLKLLGRLAPAVADPVGSRGAAPAAALARGVGRLVRTSA